MRKKERYKCCVHVHVFVHVSACALHEHVRVLGVTVCALYMYFTVYI